MNFSESLEFGDSTFLELENGVNLISADNLKENKKLEVILESPTLKSSNRSSASALTKSRLHILSAARKSHNTDDSTNYRKFGRSKSDSTLHKSSVQNKQDASDNYSLFFQSDFSFHQDVTKGKQNSIEHKNTSLLRGSQRETDRKDDIGTSNDGNNSFEKPIFSEDLEGVLGSGSTWKDSLPLTVLSDDENVNEAPEILHELSSFFCPPGCNILQKQLLKKELDISHKILKEFEHSQQNLSAHNISLSCMSPGQLKFTQVTSPVLNVEIKNKGKRTGDVKLNDGIQNSSKISNENLIALKSLKAWNLPMSILTEYERKGVKKMFDWQIQCLSNPKVIFEHCNLVYSAPTSAGKTLVSEILLLKTVLERNKKVLFILPFISVVREKMFYLQDILTAAGYRVEGFFGGYVPPGGFDSIHVAICTIEKANSIVNKLLELGKLNEIGAVIIDEVHLISDPGRGYILELLLAKILYMSRKYGLQIQIITMSATLANVELLRKWLDAELYVTDFRPVALREMIKIGNQIFDNDLNILRSVAEKSGNVNEPFPALQNDSDHVAQLCIETLVDGCSVIVFCPSKDWCENLATQLAGAIHALGKQGGEWGTRLKAQINRQAIENVKQQLRDIPTGLDAILEKCLTYGCSFHHAGLTTEERDIVEASFKSGALKIIVATSTLSSGVNLPARRVLIRSPLFGGKTMNSLTYRQMIGRAGRTGKDILGESILICTESNAREGKELISAKLKPINSCLDFDGSTHLKRALLEVISSGIATNKEDIDIFVNCTLLSTQMKIVMQEKKQDQRNATKSEFIDGSLNFLIDYEFIRLQTNVETQEQHYVATRLGNACLASSMPPADGLILFAELQKSRRCFVLESDLHAVYLVTPYSVCYQIQDLDFLLFLDLWEKLTPAMKKVGELVGVKESFLVRAMRGQTKLDYKLMQIHKRFYTALALQELVNETPINDVAIKYKCTRGMLQSLQQMSSTFAGIVTSFCNSLRWDALSLIISQFKQRLYFGIHRDLIDLVRLPDLSQKRARILFDAGVTSLVELASADVFCIEKILYNALSFDSVKKHDNENEFEAVQRNETKTFFITGKAGLTVGEAAKLFIQEARKFVQYEMGVGTINWSQTVSDKYGETDNDRNGLHMSFEKNKFQKTMVEKSLYKTVGSSENEGHICNQNYSEKATIDVIKEIEENENVGNREHTNRKKRRIAKNDSLVISNQKFLEDKNIVSSDQYTEASSEGNNIIFEGNANILKVLQNDETEESLKNTLFHDNRNIFDERTSHFLTKGHKSPENINEEKTSNSKMDSIETCSVIAAATVTRKPSGKNLETTSSISTLVGPISNPFDTKEEPSSSKKAQRLLRARQLSEMKQQEWAKRADLQKNQLVNTAETKSKIYEKSSDTINKNVKHLSKSVANTPSHVENTPNTPKTAINEERLHPPKLPRRSPRNRDMNVTAEPIKIAETKNNGETTNNNLFKNEKSFMINSNINEALKGTENFNRISTTEYKNNSPEDEIPSSQQIIEEMPDIVTNSHYSSRVLRSLRATQKIQSLRAKPSSELTKLQKSNNSECRSESSSFSSIDLSEFSSENSLVKNPILLNASHILSCSKVDTDSSSFKSLDIIDICGDQQLFKGAFKELMSQKRLGFSLGIQQQRGKRKPVIGANLLLNQVDASKREIEDTKSYAFQIDDTKYLAGIGFCISENIVYYMNMQDKGCCKFLTAEIKSKYLRMLLRSKEHTFLVFDAKEQMKILRKLFKEEETFLFALEDPKVANWLLQPDKNYNLHSLAQQFAPECSSLVSLCGSGRGYNSYGMDSENAILAKVRSSIEACVTIHILKGQIENLERIGTGQLQKFFTELEMPLQMSLCNMEYVGFPTSSEALHKLFTQMLESMKKLEAKIYEKHGARFNLGSSAAVARVLGLHRKSNGRISTSKQILEKIESPISQMIIMYRKLSVTLTKTIQPLLKSVKDERIHGQSICFTSTGRISMSEPNLQNVVKDFEIEIESEKNVLSCRSAFFPANTTRCLISSDFCQLEMRILAHLSQDSALLQVMKSENDIFAAIAARWNKISENSVTEQLRSGTKQICYGIVYGMGMRALAEGLRCTEQEAKFVSEQFHAAYPGIKSYTEKVVKFARNNGYIETITGRRRYLENINSEEALVKNQAERQAINSTIQGSAADIVKSAILRVEKNIAKYRQKLGIGLDSVSLVLHLHDELIFEVPEEKAKKIAKVLCITMENCVKLSVPLKVKLKIGKSWGEIKEIKL